MGYLKRAIEETYAHIIIEKPVVARAEEVERVRKIIKESQKQNPRRILVDAEHYSHNDLIKYYLGNMPQNIAEFGKIKKIKKIKYYIYSVAKNAHHRFLTWIISPF